MVGMERFELDSQWRCHPKHKIIPQTPPFCRINFNPKPKSENNLIYMYTWRLVKTSVEWVFEDRIEQIRKHFLKYTRQAFQFLPRIKEANILDVGCGSGIPTIELAKLSGGKITGIDIDQNTLDKLNEKIQLKGLCNRVFTKKCSLLNIDFPDESFDIIWAEGSIHIVGFEKGLRGLWRLLRQDGFLVVHDGIKDISNKLKKAPDLGYKLINHFMLPEDDWWVHYFEPLEQLINEQREKAKSIKDLRILESYQSEVNMFKTNPKENMSAFYIFQKCPKEMD